MAILEKGSRVDRWVIQEMLGKGSFGITYRAEHTNPKLKQTLRVALKEFFPADLVSRMESGSVTVTSAKKKAFADQTAEFIEEASAIARVSHPNIVRVTDLVEENGTCYMVMDLIEGPKLLSMIGTPRSKDGQKLLSIDELRPILTKLLSVLDTVHNLEPPMLHRDIKPANIMMRAPDDPVLIDFGAARQVVAGMSQKLTSILTVGYAPYEQYDDEEFEDDDNPLAAQDSLPSQGPWTDLYALAATCHFALTGRPPRASFRRKMGTDNYVPLKSRIEGDHAFLDSIDKSLSLEPGDRHQSAREWLDELEGPITITPPLQEPTGPTSKEKQPGQLPVNGGAETEVSSGGQTPSDDTQDDSKLGLKIAGGLIAAVVVVVSAIALSSGSESGSTAENTDAVADARQEVDGYLARWMNVRSGPSTTSSQVGTLSRGAFVSGEVYESTEPGSDRKWIKLDSGNYVGQFVSTANLMDDEPPAIDTSSAGEYRVLAYESGLSQPRAGAIMNETFEPGDTVNVIGTVNGFAEIPLEKGMVTYLEWEAMNGENGVKQGLGRTIKLVNGCSEAKNVLIQALGENGDVWWFKNFLSIGASKYVTIKDGGDFRTRFSEMYYNDRDIGFFTQVEFVSIGYVKLNGQETKLNRALPVIENGQFVITFCG